DDMQAGGESNVTCPDCGRKMLHKISRLMGVYLGCSAYPECKTAMIFNKMGELVALKQQPTGENCDKCGEPMVLRQSRRGWFQACIGYPECRNAIGFSGQVPSES